MDPQMAAFLRVLPSLRLDAEGCAQLVLAFPLCFGRLYQLNLCNAIDAELAAADLEELR